LANIGSTIEAVNSAAAAETTEVVAAGADEVSAAVANLFGAHAQAYQALSTQAGGSGGLLLGVVGANGQTGP
jgi:hypothetical protein